MRGPLVALTLQPENADDLAPRSPLSEGDVILFAAFVVIVALVFGSTWPAHGGRPPDGAATRAADDERFAKELS